MPEKKEGLENGLVGLAKYYGSFYEDIKADFGVESWNFFIEPETYEMLQVQVKKKNDMLEQRGDWHGRTCYSYLEGRDKPCENCHARRGSRENYYTSTKIDQKTGRRYLTESILIEHNGKPAVLEKVIDVTDTDYRDKVMAEYVATKNLSDKVLGILMEASRYITENFEMACREICTFFDADRALVTEYCLGRLNTMYSRISEPFTQVCTELSEKAIAEITQATSNLNYIWVPDVANAEHLDADLKEYWHNRGIQSILLIPMNYNGSFIGTVSLHNIRKHQDTIDNLKLIGMAVAKCIYSYAAETKAERQLYTEPLTGALNLSGLKRRAYELFREYPENEYYFCVMDIRYFGGINRRYGFELGDRILVREAELLRSVLDKDEAFCRISADVFCFVAKFPGEEKARQRFARFAAGMQCFEELKARDYTIEFHCGAYVLEKGKSVAQAIDRANLARLSLKSETRSTVAFFSEELLEKSKHETELLQDFRPALSHGELMVYFQPQCNYSSQKIVGAEALVRWKSTKHGDVSPAEFIPLLEKHGLVHELDRFVWEEVCRYQKKWKGMGLECPISVNVSRHDVLGNNICGELCALLEKYDIPKRLFPLEITETAYIKHSEELVEAVEMLKNAGFKVEMDDFGSGYSSLNALKDVAVDLLKLDMKFLDMGDNAGKGGSILNCVVRMTRWLGLEVLAEGVETKEQAEYLKNIGCDLMQGYYFARPMPAEDFEGMLLANGISGESGKRETMNTERFMESLVSNPLLFNNIGAAVIVECSEECIEALMINDSFLEMIDMTREEFLPYMKDLKGCAERIVEDQSSFALHADSPDGTRTREGCIKRKNGTTRRIRICSRTLLEGDDRSIILVCLNDVSGLARHIAG